MEDLLKCGLCDIHGFMIPAKRTREQGAEDRKKRSKDTLVEFGYALALPDSFANSWQVHARSGNDAGAGQMIMKVPSRSGIYALCIRYKCAGIGIDNNAWRLHVQGNNVRLVRHQCVLRALRDQVVSPDGALTAGMLPHLTSVSGIIAIKTNPGRAPMLSPLEQDFANVLMETATQMDDEVRVLPFDGLTSFVAQIKFLIADSRPGLPSHMVEESA
jgi:CRISPR/Cas system-associated protein Cas7 (RAMP superfamily)